MEQRERNQVMMYARRAETTGGMIADLLARCEQIQDNASLKNDYDQTKCQEFQLIRVFGTDREVRHSICTNPSSASSSGTGDSVMSERRAAGILNAFTYDMKILLRE
jgi:hypothetical protein